MSNSPAGHSPLGASGAERWMHCPASVGLSYGLIDEESDFAAIGTAAHALAAQCLNTREQAWQYLGQTVAKDGAIGIGQGILIDGDMTIAVDEYLLAIGDWHPDRNQGNSWIERRFHCPTIHRLYYGTSDFTYADFSTRTLHVWDYKNGAGVVVDVIDNPQLKYYAAGMLENLGLWGEMETVMLHIAQPNGFHFDGPIRHWSVTTVDLVDWLEDTLVPAMDRALVSRETKSGEHCRFCPARSRACPQIMADIEELEGLMKELEGRTADELPTEKLVRILDLGEVFKIAHKAALTTGFNRANGGAKLPGWKIVNQKANRVWRDGAEKALKKKLGKKAMTEPKLKSPAEVDKMPGGTALTTEYAFKPNTGLTLARDTDGRGEVSKDTKSLFKAVRKGAKS